MDRIGVDMIKKINCSVRGCKYYIGAVDVSEETGISDSIIYTCKAFPNGIPDEIAYGDNEHTSPYEGDNGIQYAKKTEDDIEDIESELKEEDMTKSQNTEQVEEKPMPNYHAFRQTDPEKYSSFRYAKDELGEGVSVVYGIYEDDGEKTAEIQSIRVDSDKFTFEEAKAKVEELGFTNDNAEEAKVETPEEDMEVETPEDDIIDNEENEEPTKEDDKKTTQDEQETVVEETDTEPTEESTDTSSTEEDEVEQKEEPKPQWTVIRSGGYTLTEDDKQKALKLKTGKLV